MNFGLVMIFKYHKILASWCDK